jgi:aspartyl-tRNA(Asn)/glutamyl-tRNA(Gln) amidotransferase subunit B
MGMNGNGKWEAVIGLEVHVQLGTKSKLFCPCSTDSFGRRANVNICPVCTGQPGVLPVLNEEAVRLAFIAAAAFECTLRDRSIFSRKNYYYPDLPKGYQVSQFDKPYSENGRLELPSGKVIGVTRIHMEEDAGKLVHALASEDLPYSLVDYNRAGVPLCEIVSEPDLRSADEAFDYLTQLKTIMQYCGVSHCDMEKGELRCDANISVRPRGQEKFGTRAEVKNMNSFRAVREAVLYEFDRQCEAVERGEVIVQETRLWDAERKCTASMRSKEEAHDYRYFPEPDLVPLVIDEAGRKRVAEELPEMPVVRRERFVSEYKLPEYDAVVLTAERGLADFFESVIKVDGGLPAKSISNWIQSELLAKLNEENRGIEDAKATPERLAELVGLVEKGVISRATGKEVFVKMWDSGKAPGVLVEELGLKQVSDSGELDTWIDEAIKANPKAVADIKAGKGQAIGALMGFVMKKTKGKANPGVVTKMIKEKIA